jgi:fido (protein-threonine AMPylation protein)
MALLDKLSFPFEETPKWRDRESITKTSGMIERITKYRLDYEGLPEDSKQFCTQQFARVVAVDYIHNLNLGEMVGTQSKEDTQEVLRKIFDESAGGKDDTIRSEKIMKEKLETMNTYRAVKLLHEKHKEMNNTGFLTVQEICDVHKVLLEGLHRDCGNIRTTETYTHWHGGAFFYPSPEVAKQRFYTLIDHHNTYMKECPPDSTTNEYTAYIFKCAARLLFEFVATHPFGDGNGRMCRLLANYVLGLITPFPVALYHTHNPERSGRDDYLEAIVRCRKNPEEGPRDLAAMLVEGAWQGWESLFHSLKRRRQLQPGVEIGPIVQKSNVWALRVEMDH